MKRVTFVLAIMLMLTVCLMGNAFALERPYNDPWEPQGEAHPWGGDDVITDPPPINKFEYTDSYATSIPVIDVVFNLFLMEKIMRLIEQHNQSVVNRYRQHTKQTHVSFSKEGIRR